MGTVDTRQAVTTIAAADNRSKDSKCRRIIASFVIVVVIVLQIQAFIPSRIGLTFGSWAWPFIDYPMYTESYPEGPIETQKVRLFFTTRSGKQTEFSRSNLAELGMAGGKMFQTHYRGPLLKGDYNAVQRLARALGKNRRLDPICEILVQTTSYRWDGLQVRVIKKTEKVFKVDE